MKVKLKSVLAGLVTLTIITTPLVAQACDGSNKDKNTQESDTSIPIESSLIFEETAPAA
ncbi:MAG: hypothetical protein AAF298_15555 [Cyanobacteria bacterium P01_A01_bin.40]